MAAAQTYYNDGIKGYTDYQSTRNRLQVLASIAIIEVDAIFNVANKVWYFRKPCEEEVQADVCPMMTIMH